MIPSYAVVPSYGRECLKQCLEALLPQAGRVFLVQTQEFEPPATGPNLTCLPWRGTDLNISAWWNLGLDAAAQATVKDAASARALMLSETSVVKRPVVQWGEGANATVTVGFDANAWPPVCDSE